MSFKIKDSFQVGTVTVVNSSGIIQDSAMPTKVTAGSGNNVTVDVYGRVTAISTTSYLTAEADTLSTVTGRGATTSVALSITNATASTTTATGCLILSGGLGVAGAIWAGSVQGTPIGSTTRSSGAFTSLDANAAVALSPANANITISPTGTGTVAISPAGALTINPTAASTINNASIGATTRAAGAFTTLAANNAVTFTAGTSSTTTGTGTAVVTGGVGISENLNVGGNIIVTGNLTVNGTTESVNSTTLVVKDPIINLGGGTDGAAPVSDDAKDRGIEFQWYDSQARTGFFGFDRSTGYCTFVPQATFTNEVISGTQGDFQATNFRGALIGNADTATKTATARAISISGDMTWTVNFDGSAAATAAGTLATVCASPGTYSSVVVNAKGLVTSGTNPGYLTAESDTLATVTGRGAVTTSDLQVNGSSIALAPSTTAKVWTKAIQPAAITVNTIVAIDSWAVATYRSAKYRIQVVQGTKYQISEVAIVHDGTTVYSTEYGVVETNAGASIPVTFSAAIATGTLTVNATITDAASTNATVTLERTLFSV